MTRGFSSKGSRCVPLTKGFWQFLLEQARLRWMLRTRTPDEVAEVALETLESGSEIALSRGAIQRIVQRTAKARTSRISK